MEYGRYAQERAKEFAQEKEVECTWGDAAQNCLVGYLTWKVQCGKQESPVGMFRESAQGSGAAH
jgi:hypothetical protein